MPSDRSKKRADAKKAQQAAKTGGAGAKSSGSAAAPTTTAGGASGDGKVSIDVVPCPLTHQLVFPPSLAPRQRALLHQVAEQYGAPHTSSGDGVTRHIRLGPNDAAKTFSLEALEAGTAADGADSSDSSGAAAWSDTQVGSFLAAHWGDAPAATYTALAAAGAPARQQQANSSKPGPHGSSSRPGIPPAAGGGGSGGKATARAPGGAGGGGQPGVTLEAFLSRTGGLLDLERAAEIQAAMDNTSQCSPETAQARGYALLNLRTADTEGGLLGRTLLTLVSNKGFGAAGPPPPLPAHKFSPHDVVALRPHAGGAQGGPPLAQGLVYRVGEGSLVVALEEAPEEGLDQPLRLEKLANEVTYKRLKATLQQLQSCSSGSAAAADALPGGRLVPVLFGQRAPHFSAAVGPSPEWRNSRLDPSQQSAIRHALAASDVGLIHGPPGTGKTTAVVECILQEAGRGNRVLAAAASNIAVDNLVERLVAAAPKLKVVRLGHPARLLPQVLSSSLEALVLKSDNSSLARDCRKEIKSLHQQMAKLEAWKRAERRQLRGELRALAKEERQRQEKAIQEVINGAQVICSTLAGAPHRHLDKQVFDVVVIDEAAQATEPACWSAILKGRKLVLAGDHLQLPPTILSPAAAAGGLGTTLFERLQAVWPGASAMLTVQYRMHHQIMDWSSQELYQGALEAHDSVAHHTLSDLPPPATGAAVASSSSSGKAGPSLSREEAAAALAPVLLLVDTAGCGAAFEERQEEEGDSRWNEGEAQAVLALVERLVAAGLAPEAIGVITPYSAQVTLLRELRPAHLGTRLEISTVDGFQGREKEAILISTVRSNATGEVGFLADARRMNVAVTRARRQVTLVGDSECLRRDAFLGRLLQHFEEQGEYISAAELVSS